MMSLMRASARRRYSTGQWPSPRVFSNADPEIPLRCCCLVPGIEYVNTISSEPTGKLSRCLERKRKPTDGSSAHWECLSTCSYYRKIETRKVKGTTDFNRDEAEHYIDLEPHGVAPDHEDYAQ